MEILYFSAPWCMPCRALGPTVETVQKEKNLNVRKINIDEEADLAKQYSITSVPTLVVVENGVETKRKMGAMTKMQLQQFLGV